MEESKCDPDWEKGDKVGKSNFSLQSKNSIEKKI
jgi:hypothetical protein